MHWILPLFNINFNRSVADPGGAKGAMAPPGPVQTSHKKCQPKATT